jgi:hypothetical protein
MHFSRSPFIACAVTATTGWRSPVPFSFPESPRWLRARPSPASARPSAQGRSFPFPMPGFNKYAATPNSWQRAASPRWPAEVSIMIVAVASSGLCRICRLGSLRPRLQAVEEQYQQYFDGESCAALSRAEYSFILLTPLPPRRSVHVWYRISMRRQKATCLLSVC